MALGEAEELVRTAEERMQQLRAELLLREESYNNHFKNGGAGEIRRWDGTCCMREHTLIFGLGRFSYI